MTPQEKANELIESFAETIQPLQYGVLIERDWAAAKECALVSADETISVLEEMPTSISTKFYIQFWQQIKKEIIATQ